MGIKGQARILFLGCIGAGFYAIYYGMFVEADPGSRGLFYLGGPLAIAVGIGGFHRLHSLFPREDFRHEGMRAQPGMTARRDHGDSPRLAGALQKLVKRDVLSLGEKQLLLRFSLVRGYDTRTRLHRFSIVLTWIVPLAALAWAGINEEFTGSTWPYVLVVVLLFYAILIFGSVSRNGSVV